MNKIFNYVDNFDKTKLDIVNSVTTDKGRVYKRQDGKQYPSITTVMSWLKKDVIQEWRNRVGEDEANKVTQTATTRGTRLHDIAEKYLCNDINYIDNKNYILKLQFDPIKKILDKNVDNIFCIEKSLYSDFLGVAGKSDCISHYKGKPAIIDFKTSRTEKRKEDIDTYFMQASAYAIMFEELTGISIPKIVIIMSVNGIDTVVFEEKRNKYCDKLIDSIREYKLKNNIDEILRL